MANSRCSVSPSPNALSHASCADSAARRTRPGGHSCTTISVTWCRPISLPCRPSRWMCFLYSLSWNMIVVRCCTLMSPRIRPELGPRNRSWRHLQTEKLPLLIRDRDTRYSAEVRLRIKSLGIQEILTAPQSPWQNPYAERFIGSIRRECLNHYVILNACHLKRTLSSYFRYYHESRTHLSLCKQCPFPREALTVGKIVAIPQLGGLHHRYESIAA